MFGKSAKINIPGVTPEGHRVPLGQDIIRPTPSVIEPTGQSMHTAKDDKTPNSKLTKESKEKSSKEDDIKLEVPSLRTNEAL